jgi:hypothetical protein
MQPQSVREAHPEGKGGCMPENLSENRETSLEEMIKVLTSGRSIANKNHLGF